MLVQAVELTKHYGTKTAVDGLSFEVRPGEVTGFLGAVFTTWTAVLMLAAFALFARSDISTST